MIVFFCTGETKSQRKTKTEEGSGRSDRKSLQESHKYRTEREATTECCRASVE